MLNRPCGRPLEGNQYDLACGGSGERGTAGPGEIAAAALLDNKRADLVGEDFGGTQQKTFELPDGAALILSVAKYESPSGKKLEDEGVTPRRAGGLEHR